MIHILRYSSFALLLENNEVVLFQLAYYVVLSTAGEVYLFLLLDTFILLKSVTGNFAVGNFAVGRFAIRKFRLRNFA